MYYVHSTVLTALLEVSYIATLTNIDKTLSGEKRRMQNLYEAVIKTKNGKCLGQQLDGKGKKTAV